MTLPVTVNSACRGYAWSRIPGGVTEASLDEMLAVATEKRGDFPEPNRIDTGIIVRNGIGAAFSIRTALGWDSEGRDSEYAAFALFNPAEAAGIDFAALLTDPFFSVPSKAAANGEITSIEYSGAPAGRPPLTAAGALLCHQHLEALPASAAGGILATYHLKSPFWLFHQVLKVPTVKTTEIVFTVTCAPWQR